MRFFLVWMAAACAVLPGQPAAAPVSVEMHGRSLIVKGWTPPAQAPAGGWASVFAVYVAGADVPPLLGEYKIASGTLTFTPRYPLAPGLRVRAVFKGSESFFDVPRVKVTSSTRVRQVYPSIATLPENQLKFYIEFSAPMSQGHAWEHIRLLKRDGQAVELPFLEIDQEMWDANMQRLTVLFDPGRIKRGVKPLEDIGPAIEAGQQYTLVIDAKWRDAAGAPMLEPFHKPFRVVEADRSPIVVASWRISEVRTGTRDPLTIDFGEPLDAALATRFIWVDGVRGRAELGPEERQWRFVPETPWRDGPLFLKVDTALEDLAGNRVGRPFEVDLFERVSRRVERETVSIPLKRK